MHCCGGEYDNEISRGATPSSLYVRRSFKGLEEVTLIGTSSIPTRVYTIEDMYRIIRIQANFRRYLCQKSFQNILNHPEKYLQGSAQSSKYVGSNYSNVVVQEKLEELQSFEWNDEFSND